MLKISAKEWEKARNDSMKEQQEKNKINDCIFAFSHDVRKELQESKRNSVNGNVYFLV